MRVAVVSAVLILLAGACAPAEPQPSRTAPSVPSPAPTSAASGGPPPPAASPSAAPAARPLAASGAIAMVRADGSLWLVDRDGGAVLLADARSGAFGLPAWSPDGSRVAAIRNGASTSTIELFDPARANPLTPTTPTVIFESAAARPFYLSWTPDGGSVSFLATEDATLSLRVAPADGSAPLDGSGPGSLVRTGSPLYFDWISADRLLAHIGGGVDAFLGEIDRQGASVTPPIAGPGLFRPFVVSSDGRSIGYVRAGSDGRDAVVVAGRDGAGEVSMPVFGVAALDFGPPGAAAGTLASIGAPDPVRSPLSVPVGPLRLLEAGTGATTTLLDGAVVSFAWSPDGTTIAAIRVVPATTDTTSAPSAGASVPVGSAAPAPDAEVRLTFVDVATGRIRSDPVVVPGQRYIEALLPYFDQYSLSHRLWAPDSSSILLPQAKGGGGTTVDVFFPDGGPPIALEGEMGFWSP